MSEDADLSALMSAVSTKAVDMVALVPQLRFHNKGLQAANSILRKQCNELSDRVSMLEAELKKHQAAETELKASLRRISRTLASVDISPEATSTPERTVTFGPSAEQTNLFNTGTPKRSGSRKLRFRDHELRKPASPSATTSAQGPSSAGVNFGTKTDSSWPPALGQSLGTPFGTPPKPDEEKTENDPFKVPGEQGVSSSSENGSFGKVLESTEDSKKPFFGANPFSESSSKPSMQTTSNGEDNKYLRRTTDSLFGSSASDSIFAVKQEAVHQTKEVDKKFPPHHENAQADVARELRTAFGATEANSGPPSHGQTSEKEGDTTAEEQKSRDNSKLFPLPTPLSRGTFGLVPIFGQTTFSGEGSGSAKPPPAASLPPPRSTSFSYRSSCIDDECFATISQMPHFKAYSVEEIRLWDYVNDDRSRWGMSSPVGTT